MEQNNADKMGDVRISDDVVAKIIGFAATDVKGVESLRGGITRDMIARAGEKNFGKSVHIEIEENCVAVKIALNLDGTVSIPEVSSMVREKISDSIESMTGMKIRDIEITIAGVNV